MADNQISEDLSDFVNECREMLDDMSATLTAVADSGLSEDVVNSVYRSLHTIKGSAQLFGFQQLSILTQALEGALEPVRDQSLPLPEPLVPHLIKSSDAVAHLLDAIENQQPLEPFDQTVEDLVIECTAIMTIAFGGGFVTQLTSWCTEQANEQANDHGRAQSSAQGPSAPSEGTVSVDSSAMDAVEPPRTQESATPAQATQLPKLPPEPIAERPPKVQAEQQPEQRAEQQPRQKPQQKPQHKTESRRTQTNEPTPTEGASASSDSIRVQVSLLDQLMNLVGELVLTKNRVVDLARIEQSTQLRELSRDIAYVTSELQFLAMKTRLQPVGNVLSKFHRIVRELARDLGKSVDFNLMGAQTELDRTLVEAIKDPITHIVRNALDHGIESPEERAAALKPAKACVTIEAYYENGQVVVAIGDDGKGLDVDAIRTKVVDRNWLTAIQVQKASDAEIIPYIFEPGFSTKASADALSGRGVGMDVVKNNIEAIGGRVDVETAHGIGTVFRLRIPLTMAIVSVMVVSVADKPFAIPGDKIQEIMQVNLEAKTPLEIVGGVPVYKLRGRLLPIVTLAQLMKMDDSYPGGTLPEIDCIVVVNTGVAIFGLAVDSIVESLDVVVKPLHPAIKQAGHFSGAAVLGDGKIALTLDISGIANYAAIDGLPIGAESEHRTVSALPETTQHGDFLIARMSSTRRIAFLLDQIYRLEKMPCDSLRFIDGFASTTYRKRRITIYDIRPDIGESQREFPWDDRKDCEVVMCRAHEGFFGILVDHIEDTVTIGGEGSESCTFDQGWFDVPGLVGNLIRRKETIVVVEPAKLRCVTRHHNLVAPAQLHELHPSRPTRILLVEDSQFFRNQVKKVLTEEGFDCEVAVDGVDALEILNRESSQGAGFDVIISDIEMPRMDGLELARSIRAHAVLDTIPLIAMTTRFRSRDQEAGFAAGFNEYLEKLNGNKLIATVREYTQSRGSCESIRRASS